MDCLTPTERQECLRRALTIPAQTQIGVGPMSVACVDAVIEIANEHSLPIMLIASRRQIECAAQGGGYVNGWTTETFARYVRERDVGGYVLLSRDHGGPWQNYLEVSRRMDRAQAMASAKASFQVDLESGYDFIHIDPSEMPGGGASEGVVLEMLFELYDFVVETARRLGQPIVIEVGTEEQNGGLNSPAGIDAFLGKIGTFCKGRQYQLPTFVVVQTGTLVKETRNVGKFATGMDGEGRARLSELVAVTRAHGVHVKEHNGDYLDEALLRFRPVVGISATNVAPEFGVAETKFLLSFCEEHSLTREADDFLALALASRKWEKWMLPATTATDRDRAVIAGHYVFGSAEFAEIFARMSVASSKRGVDLNRAVRDCVKSAILRVARPLGLAQTV